VTRADYGFGLGLAVRTDPPALPPEDQHAGVSAIIEQLTARDPEWLFRNLIAVPAERSRSCEV
jgi:hypothetical protein